jgi:hypothetical protein
MINSLTLYPIPTTFGALTNQNTTKKVSYKRILISASIGVFPFIIFSPISPHMHSLLLGGSGVFFGVRLFWVRYYGSGPKKVWWVLFLGALTGSSP